MRIRDEFFSEIHVSKVYMLANYGRLCSQLVRVPGYRYRYPGFDSRRYHIFREILGLERGCKLHKDN
jgi:hypothetical protein